jgi:ribosomal protein S1
MLQFSQSESRRFLKMSSTTLNQLIEDFSHLKLDDKEYAVDVIKKQLIEAKREAIAKRAKEAMANLKKGMVKKGKVKELYKDLEGD